MTLSLADGKDPCQRVKARMILKGFRRNPSWNFLSSTSLLAWTLAMHTGCAWHAESADHLWGPTVFRVAGPPESQAFLAEQVWLPLLVEGGKRWGITIGYFSKLLSLPMALQSPDATAQPRHPFSWHSPAAIPIGDWRISPFYLSIEREVEAEFVAKLVIGLQLSASFDKEGSNLTVGASRTTGFWPHPDAVYLLEFCGTHPLALQFLVCDEKQNASIDRCLEEVFR